MSLKAALRSLPLGATESPVVINLEGTVSAKDFKATLRAAYAAAGPRCGLITTSLWPTKYRVSAAAASGKVSSVDKTASGKKGSDSSPSGVGTGPKTIALSRPVLIKSASPASRARIQLGGALLLVCCPGVTLERVDICGVGRAGVGPTLEARALLEVTANADLFMRECDISFIAPTAPPRPPGALAAKSLPPRAPPPPPNCAGMVVEGGGRVVMERVRVCGAPRSYGMIVRGVGSQAKLDGCTVARNASSNVLACDGGVVQIGGGSTLEGSVRGFGLVATDPSTTVYISDSAITGNSRDNVYCTDGARASLERCTVAGSALRSGVRVEGDGSCCAARGTEFGRNAEFAVRASWGGWASVRGSMMADAAADKTLVEGMDSTCVTDSTHRSKPTWRFLTTAERPWSQTQELTTIRQTFLTADA
ncbi:hypothetical protein FOA52_006093 [Chlamydomonas sp. UWO 241]|nr:hypothetical protein FOA52_006093 [Chlamydomonas sp. UWO 241]